MNTVKLKNSTCITLGIFVLFITVAYPQISRAQADAAKPSGLQEKISVTDCIGRKVEVPARVKRIGCLYAFAGHVVTMLGRCQDIVAVSNGLQRDKLLLRICPEIDDAVIPKTQGGINIEELVSSRVDLVFVPVDTDRSEAERSKLEKFHIPYLVVDYHTIAEQQKTIAMIGKAIGAVDRAEKYNAYFRKCIERVRSVTDSIAEKKRLRLYHSLNEAVRTDAKDSLSTDWLQLEGVINVALNQDLKLFDGKNYAGMEQILLWNPEVILANEPTAVDEMLQNKQWSAIQAVKSKRVYQLPIGISRWGHPGSLETPLAILWTAKTVYPDRFTGLDLAAETKFFYKNFFNYELTDELISQILSGKDMRFPKHKNKKL
ncbi:MAG: ABC transporter substrate-binding protein [Pseudomonadota bacterium]